jgi:hypothetical protein
MVLDDYIVFTSKIRGKRKTTKQENNLHAKHLDFLIKCVAILTTLPQSFKRTIFSFALPSAISSLQFSHVAGNECLLL